MMIVKKISLKDVNRLNIIIKFQTAKWKNLFFYFLVCHLLILETHFVI